MGLCVYCIVPAGLEPPDGLRGLAGEPVRRVVAAGLDLWVGEQDAAAAPSVAGVRAHNAVIEAALGVGATPLPLRFGQWLEDAAGLERELAPRGADYAAALRKVRGAAEYGIRVLDPESTRAGQVEPGAADAAEGSGSGPGRAYLLRASARLGGAGAGQAAAVSRALQQAVADVVLEWKEESLPTTHGVLSASCLVPRERAAEYGERVRGVRSRFPGMRFLFTGPWPPYSFAP